MAPAQKRCNPAKTGGPQQRLGEERVWESWIRTSFGQPAASSGAPGINANSLEKLAACAMNRECVLPQAEGPKPARKRLPIWQLISCNLTCKAIH
jgi:hypothetical protein